MPLDIIDEIRPRKQERSFFREIASYAIGLLALVALGIAATWPTKAHAEEIPLHVSEQNGIIVRLMPGPCVDPASISMINPLHLPRFRAIQSFWPQKDGSMKAHAGCWAELSKEEAGEETFLLVFDDREHGAVPKAAFTRKSGQSGV